MVHCGKSVEIFLIECIVSYSQFLKIIIFIHTAKTPVRVSYVDKLKLKFNAAVKYALFANTTLKSIYT